MTGLQTPVLAGYAAPSRHLKGSKVWVANSGGPTISVSAERADPRRYRERVMTAKEKLRRRVEEFSEEEAEDANAVQNGIIGNDVSVTGAVVGASSLFALNALFARGLFRFPWLAAMLEGEPSLLIDSGKANPKVLRRECISLPELRAIARRQGFSDLGSVETAILETNGVVTMFHADEPCHYHPEHPAHPLGLLIGKRRRGPDVGA